MEALMFTSDSIKIISALSQGGTGLFALVVSVRLWNLAEILH